MADRKNFSRYNMRCGIVLRAAKGGLKLNGFDVPELDNRFLLITAADIGAENSVCVMDTRLPLLASDTIDYPGQPLLVLFGPDYEGAELEIEKIKVLTSPLDDAEAKDNEDKEDTLYYSWGLDEVEKVDEEKRKLKKTDTWMNVEHGTSSRPTRYDILAYTDQSGNIHISGPMQWNALVKDTVAAATGRLPGSIVLHNEKYNAPYDEYLLDPAFLATFVSIATTKTRIPCEIREEAIFSRPGISYHITTWTDENNKPRHEEVEISVDQGRYSIASNELKRQIMTGILPKYDVASFKGIIRTNSTATVPSIFCGSMGYTSASAARSMHNSRLASKTGTNPLVFLDNNIKSVTKFTDYAAHYDTRDMISRAHHAAQEADYLRKWTSSHLQKSRFGLMGYRTGVGIASDMGIAGFSNSSVKENDFKGVVTFNAKRHLVVSGAFPYSISQDKGTRDMLSGILSANEYNDSLLFMEDNVETPDMGPNVLSSFQSLTLPRLMRSLAKIIPLGKVQEPPFSMVFSTQDTSIPCEFVHSGHGAAVCEVILEKISLTPMVKHIWLNVSLDTFKARGLQTKVRNAVKETLVAIGAKVTDDYALDLVITEHSDDIKAFSSVETTVGSLVTGAFVSALWQAVGETSTLTIPAGAAQVERTLNGGGNEN